MPDENAPILRELPEALIGRRVLVRPYQPGDGDALWEAVDESREHIEPWLVWGPKHSSPQESEASARRAHARWILREDLMLSVWDKDEGAFLGGTGLHQINWDIPSFQIGYWIRRTAEGQGYMTEAVRLVRSLAFDTLDARRVFIRCGTGNQRSIAVAQRAGFQYEATLRNDGRDSNGNLYDVMIFTLTDEDHAAEGFTP